MAPHRCAPQGGGNRPPSLIQGGELGLGAWVSAPFCYTKNMLTEIDIRATDRVPSSGVAVGTPWGVTAVHRFGAYCANAMVV